MSEMWIEAIGWFAAIATLSAYSMRTMLPLRVIAILANVTFATYGALAEILPTLVLHLVLLPFNSWRLYELLRTERGLKETRSANDMALEWLRPMLKPVWFKDGDYIFRKGDAPDHLYILGSGSVLLEEIGVALDSEEIFGEIAFFTDTRARTLSALCVGPCEVMRVNEADFMRLYSQNPSFGMFMMKLVSQRLLDGMQRRPEAYATAPDPALTALPLGLTTDTQPR